MTQAEMLRALGAEPVVLGLRDVSSHDDLWRLEKCEVRLTDARGPRSVGFAPGLPAMLEDARLDLLHLHGIWQYHSRAAGQFAQRHHAPLVISPHGMLDPWITRRNAWKKQMGRWLWERQTWNAATRFHALTKAEAVDIKGETGSERIAVIPNAAPPITVAAPHPRPPMVLYLGRIHEKKNVHALIGAWQSIRGQLPEGASLTIAGWGDDEGITALEQAIGSGAGSGIEFVGTAFGSQKAALLDIARFLVLPSHSEGLPMAILEGWSAKVPSIMSEHCHLPEGFASGAAIDCGTSVQTIAAALLKAFDLGEADWFEMSDAASKLVQSQFSRNAVAKRWEEVYAALI